jgi:peptide/nickel transport system ATP-binding protein
LLRVADLAIADHDGNALVDGVSLSLAAGEILGLVGESGSGKTLTCRAMMRLLPGEGLAIRRGEVRLDGVDVLTLDEERMGAVRGREIGMIFQNPASHLNPVMTIGRQIAEGRRIHFGASRRVNTPSSCCGRSAFRTRRSGWTAIHTSFPAECGSAR